MPANPSTFSVTESLSSVDCAWSAVTGATGYKLSRRPKLASATNYVLLHQGTGTSYTDPVANYDPDGDLAEYYYEIVAVDGTGDSSGIEELASMPALTSGSVNGVGILASAYNTGAGPTSIARSYVNATGTVTIDAHTISAHDARLGGMGQYDNTF